MIEITFIPFAADDVVTLAEWHKDPELAHRYGGTEWPHKLWDMIQKDSNRKCWVVWSNDKRIGYVDVEIHEKENLAWIGLAVKPALRRKGLGIRILQEFLHMPMAQAFSEIWAGIEQDNIASIHCFSGVGFQPLTKDADEEGIIDYLLQVKRS